MRSFLPAFLFLTSGLELRELGGLSDLSLSLGLSLDFTLRFLDFFFFLLLLLTELSLPKDNNENIKCQLLTTLHNIVEHLSVRNHE